MSVPSSPTRFAAQGDRAILHSSLPRTRTVAIVKNHALHYRLDIEPRISEAGFEVREIPHTYPASTRLIHVTLIDCEREADGV